MQKYVIKCSEDNTYFLGWGIVRWGEKDQARQFTCKQANEALKLIRSEYSKYGPIVDMKLVKVKL